MPRIILIETSTSLCTTALVEGDRIVARRESPEPRSQAAMTAPFIKEMLDERGITTKDCDAVCVSCGPGSYTGLRVGVSTAKGLCFGAGLPLIAVSTLDLLVHQAIEAGLPEGTDAIIPMIDARRMEVYTAIYTPDAERISEIAPEIVTAESFAQALDGRRVVLIGDGAAKCAEVLAAESRTIDVRQECPRAESMLAPALKAWENKKFEDVAYFEPFYLKQFVATESRKKLF